MVNKSTYTHCTFLYKSKDKLTKEVCYGIKIKNLINGYYI